MSVVVFNGATVALIKADICCYVLAAILPPEQERKDV